MHILDDVCRFMVEKAVPTLKEVGTPIAKRVFCNVTSTEKKKELVIKQIKKMSEEELDKIIKKNHPLGFIGVHILSREAKLEKVIDAINKMNDSEINDIIMSS